MLSWFPATASEAAGWPHPASGIAPDCRLVVCGAHGGSGTTTIAALLRPALDAGTVRIAGPGFPARARDDGGPLLLTCRPTTWSATMATAAVKALTSAGQRVGVLVIVDDGWPETPVASARFRLLSAQTVAVVRMPFVPALRDCSDPFSVRLPRGARRALAQIRALAAVPALAGPVYREIRHEQLG